MAMSLVALCAVACTDDRKIKRDDNAVGTTRTTNAIVVDPTLHEGHAAEPEKVEQNNVEDEVIELDGDHIDMSGPRDGGANNY